MDVSYLELKNRYASLTTDELLEIYISSDLTKTASELICMELNKRDVTLDHYQLASKSVRALEAFRAETRQHFARRTWRIAAATVVFALLAIGSVLRKLLEQ